MNHFVMLAISDSDRDAIGYIAELAVPICFIGALLWAIIHSAMKHSGHEAWPGLLNNSDGPGNYKIIGVDKASKMDTTWHTQAASRENARVKAELEGIIVTSIVKEG